jgi:hypothetical protein
MNYFTPEGKERYSIGAVLFGEPDEQAPAGFRLTSVMGDDRVALLQLVRDGKGLPNHVILIGQSRYHGFQRITPDQIAWETGLIEPS